ncbi:MAG TPA: glycosyltransferase family protein [Vicinamibacteria bacterium]
MTVAAEAPVWIVVSARMASSRYPGKALVPLAGRPLLEVLLRRMEGARGVAGVAFATSMNPENDPLAELASGLGVTVFRGREDDVLHRHLACARNLGAAHVVRVTGDNPLTDVETLERLVGRHLAEGADYTYVPGEALLMGILPEVIATEALARSWERGEARHRSELVTLYIKEHPQEFHIVTEALPQGLYRPDFRLTVDEPEDVALMQAVFERLGQDGAAVSTRDALALLDREPDLARLNSHLRHKPHNLRSVALDSSITNGQTEPPSSQRTQR